MKFYVEMEVEYTRTEKVLIEVDPDDGFSTVGAPPAVGRVLRTMNYWMHRGKSLTRHESPRLLRWRFVDHLPIECELTAPQFDNTCSCAEKLPGLAKTSEQALKAAAE